MDWLMFVKIGWKMKYLNSVENSLEFLGGFIMYNYDCG